MGWLGQLWEGVGMVSKGGREEGSLGKGLGGQESVLRMFGERGGGSGRFWAGWWRMWESPGKVWARSGMVWGGCGKVCVGLRSSGAGSGDGLGGCAWVWGGSEKALPGSERV